MVNLKYFFLLWWRLVTVNFSIIAASRLDFLTLVIGKMIRMFFFVAFFSGLFAVVQTIGGYAKGEVLFFFAVMNLMDILIQLLWFRGMTDLQRVVRTGEFDAVLTKPMSPLFWTSFRILDFMDLVTVPVAVGILAYAMHLLPVPLAPGALVLGSILVVLGLIVAYAVNLAVASLTFWTTELDQAWWIFRDLTYVTRFPTDIFPRLVQTLFIFIVPIFVIVVFPAKGFLGILSPALIGWAFAAAALFLSLALFIWRTAIRHYTSASS